MSYDRIEWDNGTIFNSGTSQQPTYDNTKLNLKADKSYVDDMLVGKANKLDLEKVIDDLELKADQSEMNNFNDGLVLKADKTYVDDELILKADVTDLTTTNSNVTNNTNAINTITQQVATIKVLTQAEYDALGSSKNTDNILYLIKG